MSFSLKLKIGDIEPLGFCNWRLKKKKKKQQQNIVYDTETHTIFFKKVNVREWLEFNLYLSLSVHSNAQTDENGNAQNKHL